MSDDSESRRAFDEWRMSFLNSKTKPLKSWTEFDIWQAAMRWARQDERERLAVMAEKRFDESEKALADDPAPFLMTRERFPGLSADEIRKGRINGND